ncbi:uncharacterized protein BDV17DRAFT_72379 [Aspergillus undulatus]|uniref:uncharacterized protein n=1 Tax=Aspergillus undulatus TaxID=1810928 RepID=UPI003CCDDA97
MDISIPAGLPSPITDKTLSPRPEDKDFAHRDVNNNINETLSNRLTKLANSSRLNQNQTTNPSILDIGSINQCLDTLESLLAEDPRPNLTREITLCRPSSPQSQPQPHPSTDLDSATNNNETPTSRSPPTLWTINNHARSRSLGEVPTRPRERLPFESLAFHNQVKMLDEELKTLGAEFLERREETLRIYTLYDKERKRLRDRIGELEEEIEELRADMQEEMAEREALQGTVRGLKYWLDGLSKEDNPPRQDSGGRGWWGKKKVGKLGSFDAEALFDGMSAWMRGWSDVEEEFRNRDTARRLRRAIKSKRQAGAQEITTISSSRQPSDID